MFLVFVFTRQNKEEYTISDVCAVIVDLIIRQGNTIIARPSQGQVLMKLASN